VKRKQERLAWEQRMVVLQTANQSLQSKVVEQERLLSSLDTERRIQTQQLAAENEDNRMLVSKLGSKIESLDTEVVNYRAEIQVKLCNVVFVSLVSWKLLQKLTALKNSLLNECREKNASIEQLNKDSQVQGMDMSALKEESQREIELRQQEIESQSKHIRNLINEKEELRQLLEKQASEWKLSNGAMQTEINSQKLENVEARKECEALKANIHVKEKELIDIQNSFKKCSIELCSNGESLVKSDARLKELEVEVDMVKADNDVKNQLIATLKKAVVQHELSVSSLKHSSDCQGVEIAALRSQVEDSKSHQMTLQQMGTYLPS